MRRRPWSAALLALALLIPSARRLPADPVKEVAQAAGQGEQPADSRALGVTELRQRLLGDAAPEVRAIAARELLDRATPEALAALRDGFKSGRDPVLVALLAAIAGKRDPRFAAEVAGLVASAKEPVATAALNAVGELPYASVVRALAETLAAQTNGVEARKRLLAALGLTRHPEAVEALLPHLDGPKEIAAEAHKALHALTYARFSSRADWEAWYARNRDRGRERWLEDALAAMSGSVQTVDTNLQALEARVRERGAQLVQVRLEEARRSGKADAELTLLIGFLENKEFADVRDRVLEELARVGRQKAAAAVPVAVRLLEDADRRVVLAAIRCLGEIGDAPAAEALGRFLAPVQDQETRRAAARALPRIATPNVLPLLVGALEDPDPAVLLGVIEGVKTVRARSALPKLKEILVARREQSELVRAVLDALGEIGDPEAVPILVEFIGGSDPEKDHPARWSAANSLGKLGRPEAVDALVGLLEDQFTDVRQAAVEAIGRIGDARAGEALGRTVRLDKDPVVRELAAQSLGKIGDLAAVDLLLPVLDDAEPRVVKAAWTSTLALAGKDAALLGSLVDKLYAAKHPKEALDVLRRLAPPPATDPAALTPAQINAQLRLGKALFEAKESKEAQPVLETSAKWWPDNREIKTMLGVVYREQGNADGAATLFKELLEGVEPGLPEWWNIKVEQLAVRLVKKEFDHVLREVQKLADGPPPAPEAWRPRLDQLRTAAQKGAADAQARQEELNRKVRGLVVGARGATGEKLAQPAQELVRIGRDAVPVLLAILREDAAEDWPAASHFLGAITNIPSALGADSPPEQREKAIQDWAEWLNKK